MSHTFVLAAGSWRGYGHISIGEKIMAYDTFWSVREDAESEEEAFSAVQMFHLENNEAWSSQFSFSHFTKKSFSVKVVNSRLGPMLGLGKYDDAQIRWKLFDNNNRVVGEVQYLLEPDGTYDVQSRYVSPQGEVMTVTGKLTPTYSHSKQY